MIVSVIFAGASPLQIPCPFGQAHAGHPQAAFTDLRKQKFPKASTFASLGDLRDKSCHRPVTPHPPSPLPDL